MSPSLPCASFVSRRPVVLPLLVVLMATGSVVYIEPAPFDGLAAGLIVLSFLLGLRFPAAIAPAAGLMGFFLLGNVIAAALSPEPSETFRSLLIRFYLVAFWFWLSCLICDSPGPVLRAVWNGFVISAVIAACVGIAGYFDLPAPDRVVDRGRVQAFFKDPNVYGPFLVTAAIYSLARLQISRGRSQLLHIFLFLLMTLGVLIAFSRGAWLNMVVSVLAYFALQNRVLRAPAQRKRLAVAGLTLVIGAMSILAAALSSEEVRNTLDRRARLVMAYDVAEEGRFTNQLRVLRSSLSHPLGLGPGMTKKEYFFDRSPHNLYLHVVSEAGWLGGFAYWLFLLLTLGAGLRLIRQRSALQSLHVAALACVVGTLIQSLFIDSTHWRHMYMLFALVWGPYLATLRPRIDVRS